MPKNFTNRISTIESEALELLDRTRSENDLEKWRIEILGRRGQITRILRGISELDPDSRQAAGAEANQLKIRLQAAFEKSKARINSDQTVTSTHTDDAIDVTLPGRKVRSGSLHPTTQIVREISNAFSTMGFQVLDGPEVELDAYNFQKLNIPAHHPARDMWNSLWIDRASESGEYPLLLRTHTSPMQIRVMEKNDPPLRVIVPGKAYRYEATDATHEWQFCQIEGLAIDRDITFADLKGTLEEFARIIFGAKRQT